MMNGLGYYFFFYNDGTFYFTYHLLNDTLLLEIRGTAQIVTNIIPGYSRFIGY